MKKAFDKHGKSSGYKIVNDTPSGIVNFSQPTRKIYKTIYKGMLDRTWFPAQVDLTEEPKRLLSITDAQVRMYKLTFGKLIFNDSVIGTRIVNLREHITDPIVVACMDRQAWEEANHSESYAYIGDDVLKDAGIDSTEIYDLWKTDQKLLEIAEHIDSNYEMFKKQCSDISDEDKAIAAIANIALEGISFPHGFLPLWSIDGTMLGSASMIDEISKDELGSHIPLYINIYNHIKEDTGVNVDGKAVDMLVKTGEMELEYLRYSTDGVLGFTHDNTENFTRWIVNERCRELGFKQPYSGVNSKDGLISIYKRHLNLNGIKTNFFEGTVKNYSKKKLDMDF